MRTLEQVKEHPEEYDWYYEGKKYYWFIRGAWTIWTLDDTDCEDEYDDGGYTSEDGVYHWQCETCGEWDGNCFGPWDEE